LLALTALAADVDAGNTAEQKETGLRVEWLPEAEFYPQYIADPLRPQSALKILYLADSEIPETGSSRFGLHLGGRFGLVRWHPDGQPDRGWQLDFEGGFFGQFDIGNSLDNIGWDGLFGLYLSWLPTADLGFRVGTKHDSAHVGDEYAERTGRRRIGYTREELVAGVSWRPAEKWRIYVEGGYGYGLGDFQDPGRLQAGAEYFGARRFWKNHMSWYAAVDLQSFRENDWSVRSAIQLGLLLPTGRGTGRYRFALELVHGRSVMGEFSFRHETSIGVGWYFDF
jgi:hypothetical protein